MQRVQPLPPPGNLIEEENLGKCACEREEEASTIYFVLFSCLSATLQRCNLGTPTSYVRVTSIDICLSTLSSLCGVGLSTATISPFLQYRYFQVSSFALHGVVIHTYERAHGSLQSIYPPAPLLYTRTLVCTSIAHKTGPSCLWVMLS